MFYGKISDESHLFCDQCSYSYWLILASPIFFVRNGLNLQGCDCNNKHLLTVLHVLDVLVSPITLKSIEKKKKKEESPTQILGKERVNFPEKVPTNRDLLKLFRIWRGVPNMLKSQNWEQQ